MSHYNPLKVAFVLVLLAAMASAGRATDSTWNVDGGGHWSVPGNWDNNMPPNGTDHIARLTYDITHDASVRIDAGTPFSGVALGSLYLCDDWYSYTLDAEGFRALSIVASSGEGLIHSSGSPCTHAIEAPLVLERSVQVTVDSKQLNISGSISGGSVPGTGIRKDGEGTLTLSAGNSYSGVTSVEEGVLTIQHGLALGAFGGPNRHTSVFDGATLEIEFTGQLSSFCVDEDLKLEGFGVCGTDALRNEVGYNTWRGGVELQGDAGILVNWDYELKITGVISSRPLGLHEEPKGITKDGNGVLELCGANTHGHTRIKRGVVRAADGVGLPTSSKLIFDGGVLETSGTFNRSLGPGPGEVQFVGSGGFSATVPKLTVNLGGQPTPVGLTWGQPWFVGDGDTLIFGSPTAALQTDFCHPIDLADGDRTITVDDNPKTGTDFAILSGTLSNGSLTKEGPGRLVLSGNNSLSNTTAAGGILELGSPTALGSQDLTISGGGVLDMAGFSNSVQVVMLNHGAITGVGSTLTGTSYQVKKGLVSVTLAGIGSPLTKTGSGTVALLPPVANTYSGTTTLQGGALLANDGVGLPAFSHLVLDGGVLEGDGSSGPVAFTRPLGETPSDVRWIGSGGFSASGSKMTVDVGGALETLAWGQLNFVPHGSALVFGSETATAETDFQNPLYLGTTVRTIRVNDNFGANTDFAHLSGGPSGGVALSGAGGLNKTGTGVLLLTTPNSYSGPTTVLAGALVIRHDFGLGSSEAGTSVSSGATLGLSGDILVSEEALELAGRGVAWGGALRCLGGNPEWAGPVALIADSSIGVDYDGCTLTVSGRIDDRGAARALRKVGPGILVLSGPNTYTGATTVKLGTLRLDLPEILSNNAALYVHRNCTVEMWDGGEETVDGLYGEAPSWIDLNGGTLAVGFAGGGGTFAGSLRDGLEQPPGNLVKLGPGTQKLTGGNPLSGTITIHRGTLELADGGGAASVSDVLVESPGRLYLNNSGTNNFNRIGNSAGLALRGGTLEHDGKEDAASSETLGPLRIESAPFGASSAALVETDYAGAGGSSRLTFASLARTGGTVEFTGTGLGTTSANRILFTTPPTLTDGILPYATVNDEAVSYSTLNGITPASYTQLPGTGPPPTPQDNVKLVAPVRLTGNMRINSLHFGSGYRVDTNGFELYLDSGAFIVPGGAGSLVTDSAGGGVLRCGIPEIFAHVNGDLVIEADLAGHTLLKAGAGTLVLAGRAHYLGPTLIDGGTLRLDGSGWFESREISVAETSVFDVRDVAPFKLPSGGIIAGSGTVLGGLFIDLGTVAPGAGPATGELSVDDVGFRWGSVLQIELASGLHYDALVSSGTITLQQQSTLDVTLLGPFMPDAGDAFEILRFAGLSGTFGMVNLPDLAWGLRWNTEELYTLGTIKVIYRPTLTSIAPGNWNAPSTWDHGTLIPAPSIDAVVDTYTVAVAADGAALSLAIRDGGAVLLNADKALQIVQTVKVADGTLQIAPGGKLNVGTDATLGIDSQYVCELGRTGNGLIAASGDVLVGDQSTLSVKAIGNLGNPGEKQRTIITAAGAVKGTFTNEPGSGDYLGFGVFYTGSENATSAYNVTVLQAQPGDADGDADVDPADLARLAIHWDPVGMQVNAWPDGDFDFDGCVGPADLANLAVNWSPAGYSSPPEGAATPTSVPEPSTLLLLSIAALGLVACAWGRKGKGGRADLSIY